MSGASSPYPLVVTFASTPYQIQIRQVIRRKQSILIPSMTGISQTGAMGVHGRHMSTTRYCITPGGTASQKGILFDGGDVPGIDPLRFRNAQRRDSLKIGLVSEMTVFFPNLYIYVYYPLFSHLY
jgi:hypothetical protein